jgi:broad specificity phosphatase PhoE
MWKQSRIDPSGLTWPNGESFAQTAERGVRSFNSIIEANQGQLVAAVTHDIIVRIIATYVLGASYSIYRRLEAGNTSITKIAVIDNKKRLITLNDTSHLGF